MILLYPLALLIVVAMYFIGLVIWTFSAVFLCLLVPFVLYVGTFVVVGVMEVSRAIWRRSRPGRVEVRRSPTRPISQARWSNRR